MQLYVSCPLPYNVLLCYFLVSLSILLSFSSLTVIGPDGARESETVLLSS